MLLAEVPVLSSRLVEIAEKAPFGSLGSSSSLG